MYGKPFNEKRAYGTVFGSGAIHFEQDGNLYNAMKQPVDINGELLPFEPVNEAPSVSTQASPAAPPPPADHPDDDVPADEKPFNLLAWAQGDETLAATPWAKIKAETARMIDDMTGIKGKDDARKAILQHYGVSA